MRPSIKKFELGNFITKIGETGEGPGQQHLAIDSDGNIYVSDRGNNRIQAFSPSIPQISPTPTRPSTTGSTKEYDS